MPTFQYNKLVRDDIPARHDKRGHTVTMKQLKGNELTEALCEKLHEEADEVHAASTHDELIEEIADVQQIIDDLCYNLHISEEQLRSVQKMKRDKKGGFTQGSYIEKVYIPDENDKWTMYCREFPDKFPEIKD